MSADHKDRLVYTFKVERAISMTKKALATSWKRLAVPFGRKKWLLLEVFVNTQPSLYGNLPLAASSQKRHMMLSSGKSQGMPLWPFQLLLFVNDHISNGYSLALSTISPSFLTLREPSPTTRPRQKRKLPRINTGSTTFHALSASLTPLPKK